MHTVGDIITGVVDIGTENVKIGYADMSVPVTFCASAREKNGFVSPVTRSVVTDVASYLGILCEGIPGDVESLVIAENTMERGDVKREVLAYLMERRMCGSVLFVRSGILDAFSHGKTTAVVVSLGGGSTQVCSVVDGFITCRRQLDVGGVDLTRVFRDMVDCGQGLEFERNEMARHVKEEVLGGSLQSVDLCTGSVDVGGSCVAVLQRLGGAARLVCEVIEGNGPEVRQTLAGNVVVTGGGTGIRGIETMLGEQLEKDCGKWRCKVWMEKNMFSTFVGGSVVGSMGSTKSLHIGAGDYEEYGDAILERKRCDWMAEVQGP